MNLNEMRDRAAQLVTAQEGILAREHPDGDFRLTAEDAAEFDRIQDELRELEVEIERRVSVEASRSRLDQPGSEGVRPSAINSADPEEREAAYHSVWSKWLHGGRDALTSEERTVLATAGRVTDPDLAEEVRAQTVTTTGGGYTIPQGFVDRLQQALKAFGGVRQRAQILRTASGNPLPWPTVDETAVQGELLGINTQAASADVTFGQTTLNAYKWSSKVVLVPIELTQDTGIDLEAYLAKALATRIGRVEDTYFTTGTGTAQPQGFTVAASAGVTSGAASAVSYDDLVELEHSVDPLYRVGNVAFAFKDSTLKLLKKLKDAEGRPLWSAGMASGETATILGYPYFVAQNMAAATTGLKSIVFGNWDYFVIRDVLETTLIRFDERYMDFLQIGFLAVSRSDSRGVAGEATFGALKLLTQA